MVWLGFHARHDHLRRDPDFFRGIGLFFSLIFKYISHKIFIDRPEGQKIAHCRIERWRKCASSQAGHSFADPRETPCLIASKFHLRPGEHPSIRSRKRYLVSVSGLNTEHTNPEQQSW